MEGPACVGETCPSTEEDPNVGRVCDACLHKNDILAVVYSCGLCSQRHDTHSVTSDLSLGVTVQGLYGEGLPLMLYERPPSGVLKLIVDVLLLYMRILEP